ncbi:MAG: TetR/AcrR family transcriptional regulator [Chloroflexota bacterium]
MRKKRRTRNALIEATLTMITEHGIDKFTMLDVTNSADVAFATAYNYFDSKEDLVAAAMETVMGRLAEKIEEKTLNFSDPSHIFPFGLKTVLTVMSFDDRFRWLQKRPDMLARSIYRCFGPYAKNDIQKGVEASRFQVNDVETVWLQVSWSIVGVAVGISQNNLPLDVLQTSVINIIKMLGVESAAAVDLYNKLPAPLNIDES